MEFGDTTGRIAPFPSPKFRKVLSAAPQDRSVRRNPAEARPGPCPPEYRLRVSRPLLLRASELRYANDLRADFSLSRGMRSDREKFAWDEWSRFRLPGIEGT